MTFNRVAIAVGCVGASSILIYGLYRLNAYWVKERVKKKVGVVKSLIIYPVKACYGMEVEEARCTDYGLASLDYRLRDRQFMVADSDGVFVSGRTHPTLVNIKPSIEEDDLILNAPGVDPLRINLKNMAIKTENIVPCSVFRQNFLAVECDEESHAWFSSYLKSPVRLLYFNPELCKRPLEVLEKGYHNRLKRSSQFKGESMFPDGYPYLAVNEQSCEDFNTNVDSSSQISYKTFRPNILISTDEPWIEDSWRGINIGDQQFFNEKPCGRCRNVNVHPETAEVHPRAEPLNTLRKHRILKDYQIKSPSFGINLVIEGPSSLVKVGDSVIA